MLSFTWRAAELAVPQMVSHQHPALSLQWLLGLGLPKQHPAVFSALHLVLLKQLQGSALVAEQPPTQRAWGPVC